MLWINILRAYIYRIFLTIGNSAIALAIEQLEGGPVEGIWSAEQTLESLELREGDESILASVRNVCQQAHRFLFRK